MKKVLIIGGTGFVGTALTRRLATADFSLLVPTRNPERCQHLAGVPRVTVIAADVHADADLARLMVGQEIVISLVGILKGDFQRVHAELPGRIARAAKAAGLPRLVHISSLGAAADAPSIYLRTKAAGEAALKAAYPAATIFQPSVIFGQGDSFLTLFADLLKIAPFVPLACPEARFQPVWIEDVVSAVEASLDRPESAGQTYPLGGPRVYTLRDLVSYAGQVSGHPRPILGLPLSLSYAQAFLMEFVPNGPMTRDNVRSMQKPNVCPPGITLPFGLTATALEDVAPGYLAG